jgi:EAL domain-containing protein (putative c-di-GMP-specific phosphodiesterase class I)
VSTTLLDRIFAPGGLRPRFQPVLDAAAFAPCYVEGLIGGPEGTNLERADVLFSYVRRKRETVRMDRLCVATLLEAARVLPASTTIGLNVDAETLTVDREFPGFLTAFAARHGIAPDRLVIEIVEHTPPRDTASFRAAVRILSSLGVRIALDDVGCAHSNYQMMIETRPHFFKVDRYFVAGAHADGLRREILRSIVQLGRAFGARVVAEGVEHRADLEVVREAGIDLVQGYLLMRPLAPDPLGVLLRQERVLEIPDEDETDDEGRSVHSVEEHGYR